MEKIPNANEPRNRIVTVDPEYGEAFWKACTQLNIIPATTKDPALERMSGPRTGNTTSRWKLSFPDYQTERQFYQTYNDLTAEVRLQ